jgi:hypothetical protein
MDYHSKYLKYKSKYSNLQKMIAGNPDVKRYLLEGLSDKQVVNLPDTFLEQLQNIYPKTKYDYKKLNNTYNGHITTYGEMEYEGMHNILNHLSKDHNINFNNFIDLGSGRGKLPLQVAAVSDNIVRSIGIELVKERHDEAVEIKEKLKQFKNITDKVVFINDDFNKIDLLSYINGITLVWISNLCFPQELTNNIFSKLIDILPHGSIITCSKEHLLQTHKLSKIGILQVPMSWNKDSNIFIYKII